MFSRLIFYISFASLALIFSCSCSGNSSSKQSTLTSEMKAQQDSTQLEDEDFNLFLEEFNSDAKFQKSRVQFPIVVTVPDTDDMGRASMDETIQSYEWEPLDLSYDTTFLNRSYDQYYQTVRFSADSAIVELRGINNGIYADYCFLLQNKCWYLVSMKEISF